MPARRWHYRPGRISQPSKHVWNRPDAARQPVDDRVSADDRDAEQGEHAGSHPDGDADTMPSPAATALGFRPFRQLGPDGLAAVVAIRHWVLLILQRQHGS